MTGHIDHTRASAPCRWCRRPIALIDCGGRPVWVHTGPGGAFPCRDKQTNMRLPTQATPPDDPPPDDPARLPAPAAPQRPALPTGTPSRSGRPGAGVLGGDVVAVGRYRMPAYRASPAAVPSPARPGRQGLPRHEAHRARRAGRARGWWHRWALLLPPLAHRQRTASLRRLSVALRPPPAPSAKRPAV